jgi:hypothetical protein
MDETFFVVCNCSDVVLHFFYIIVAFFVLNLYTFALLIFIYRALLLLKKNFRLEIPIESTRPSGVFEYTLVKKHVSLNIYE